MLAHVRVGNGRSSEFEVRNGLSQGCTLASDIFNISFAAVVAHWRSIFSVPGFPLRYRSGRKFSCFII